MRMVKPLARPDARLPRPLSPILVVWEMACIPSLRDGAIVPAPGREIDRMGE